MRTPSILLATLAFLVLVPSAVEAQDQTWVHLHVEENEETQVRLNLPISMVSMAFESLRAQALSETGQGGGPGLADARRLWLAMRDAGDAEFLDVRDEGERMRVFREGDRVYVEGDAADGTELIRVEMPVAVADALLADETATVDLAEVIESLVENGESELVRIRDGDATVRLWADGRNTQD